MTDADQELFGERYPVISRYVELLADRGVQWGLIGPREVERLWDRHILNSVAVHELVTAGLTVVDVGSGAGLPGIPMAVLRGDLEVTLIEPLLRRSTFLTQVVDELGITEQVRVVRDRAEDHRDTYDVVLSRALAPLPRLISWCAPLRNRAGTVLALKGSSAAQEVAAADGPLRSSGLSAEVLSVRAHPFAAPTTVVRLTGR